MSLSGIKNKLYKKETDKDLVKHEPTAYDPHVADLPKVNPAKPGDLWTEAEETIGKEERKIIGKGIWVLGGVLLVVILLVTAVHRPPVGFFQKSGSYHHQRSGQGGKRPPHHLRNRL